MLASDRLPRSEYNAGLKQRGSITFWLSTDVIEKWLLQEKTGRRGASYTYSDIAIATMSTVKSVFSLAGRQTQGFLESLFKLMHLDLPVPDHSLRIFGDKGVLSIKDCWFYNSPVHLRRMFNIRRKMFLSPIKQKYRLQNSKSRKFNYRAAFQMDFARGIAEVANAIAEKRPCRLSARYSLHVNELVLAIHNAKQNNGTYKINSSFEPIEPMPWAE